MIQNQPRSRERRGLEILICIHIVVCCASLISIAAYRYPVAFDPTTFHIFFEPSRWYVAAAAVAAFALVASLFASAKFSFGYFVGFNLYTMVLGYLWLNCFTDLKYDHWTAGLSAAASAVAFLMPALFITSPVRRSFVLSEAGFDRLLTFILLLATVTVATGAAYDFRLVSVEDIYDFRDKLESPTILNYLTGMTASALLPFAFAVFAARRAWWRAGVVLFLLLLFYPITLSKLALFSPLWLVAILLLSRFFEARLAVVLSLLAPMLAGLVLIGLFKGSAASFFSTVNFRMFAVPSVAMDVYSDFFSTHDLTHFCQISVLRALMQCPYQEQLSLLMQSAYHLGNFNGSLFATEGIASVGILFAPVAVLACGLVIALGNRASAGLPTGFILVSGAILTQALLNVPLTVGLVTHGGGLLFLLWYITPRTIFEQRTVVHAVTGKRPCGREAPPPVVPRRLFRYPAWESSPSRLDGGGRE
jgi:hypothetical protein